MKNLQVLKAKDGHSLGEMVENLDALMGEKMTDETIEEIGSADLTCYKCGVVDGTVREVEAMDQTINYCEGCYDQFMETHFS